MAGCFGNSPYDRYVEGQLNNYLKECDEAAEMDNLVEDMMRDAVTDAALFRTYDDDFEVIDRDQVMRCLANLDDAIKRFNVIFSYAQSNYTGLNSNSRFGIDAIFTALTIMQKNLQKAVEHEAEKAIASRNEMKAFGEKE